MPHCVILYTPNLERKADITALCRAVADAMLTIRDENGKQVFPTAGTRVPTGWLVLAPDGRFDPSLWPPVVFAEPGDALDHGLDAEAWRDVHAGPLREEFAEQPLLGCHELRRENVQPQ